MSLLTKRAEIKEALDAIDGITGYEKEPRAPKAGDAWPDLIGINRDSGFAEVSWSVYVVLTQNEDGAITWFEENADSLIAGLQYPEPNIPSAGYVDGINKVNLGSPTSPVYGLEINLRSE
jgi:hypothetical protein